MAAGGQRAARSKPGPLTRVFRAWRAIAPEQRVCALAALSLWITMFLPWYSETPAGVLKKGESIAGASLSAYGAFSFVEAAVLLVSIGVLALLFARGERRAFHLPGGDGTVIMLAGAWVGLLVVYRMFDKQGTRAVGSDVAITSGIQWGIFLALFAAIWLAWTGLRIRRSHRAEPALADDPTVHLQARASRAARARRRAGRGGGDRALAPARRSSRATTISSASTAGSPARTPNSSPSSCRASSATTSRTDPGSRSGPLRRAGTRSPEVRSAPRPSYH